MLEKNYYRIMLGHKSSLAKECYEGSWFGGDWDFDFDLSKYLNDEWDQFKRRLNPIYLDKHPDKSKVTAGLASGMLYTISKGIKQGDIVLCPDGEGSYYVGEVVSDYKFIPDAPYRHQRKVSWHNVTIPRSEMSEALQRSTGSIGTVANITKHEVEIERLIDGKAPPKIVSTDESIEDPSAFALEKHLEDFLVANWSQTELGIDYDIFELDGELIGQQYPSDTGPIDILAQSKDKKELLVVELKKGRASDVVVGQIQRYMGYVLDDLAEDNQTVKGIIIALEDDLRLRRALSVTTNIDFYRYQVRFNLYKNGE